MREIKFRAWLSAGSDTSDGCFFSPDIVVVGPDYAICDGDEYPLTGEPGNCVTLEQFTGERDKNGNEIYEGDIFNLGDLKIKYVVEWIDCGFQGRQINNKSTVGLDYWKEKIKVIGNIHKNPELL